jgi:type II secretory pathway pseudopilin PulG
MRARRRAGERHPPPLRPISDESGFSILESVIALSMVFAVLVVLLGGLTAGARGLVAGRQRGVAVALANSVFENARGRAYGEVGHDFDSDPTLASDPLVTGTAPNQVYTGVSPAEPLAGSTVDAGPTGGTNANDLFPFSPHRSMSAKDGTTYTTTVHVTTVTPASGDSYKRISVAVTWTPAQYATAARSVEMSTYLYDALPPPDPRLTGLGEADAGTFTVCPVSTDPCTLAGISLSQVRMSLPYVSGAVDSGFIKTAKGTANSGSSVIDLLAGTPVGASCDLLGLSITCSGAKADASADNDTGTAPPDTGQEGPVSGASGTTLAGAVLSATLGSGTAQAQATGRSCWACQAVGSPNVGDDDMLPHFAGNAAGPADLSVGITSGLSGSLLSVPDGCAVNCSMVTVDRADVGGAANLTSTATVNYPALKLMTLNGVLPNGMVQISGGRATATASSGPGTGPPAVTGTPLTVELWDGAGYDSYTVTPGDAAPASDPTTTASISVPLTGISVAMTATLHWSDEVTSTTGPVGGLTENSASLNNWLWVEVHTVIELLGVTITDLTLHLDLGRVAATATYQELS